MAIVVPDFEGVEAHYKRLGEPKYREDMPEDMCKSKEVNELILKSILQLAAENRFNSLEKPKKIHLCPREFVKENPDMVTTTFKMKRSVGAKHFRKQIDLMYSNETQLLL